MSALDESLSMVFDVDISAFHSCVVVVVVVVDLSAIY
jgi:hypothetical protein